MTPTTLLPERQPGWVVVGSIATTAFLGVMWNFAAPVLAVLLATTLLRNNPLGRQLVLVFGALFLLHFFVMLDPFNFDVDKAPTRTY